MVMNFKRLLRHLVASHRRTRRHFSPAVQAEIEATIREMESRHAGEIRFAVETALHWPQLWRGLTPRQRALELFAQLHVWDTQANNGVLVYVAMADRAVEIIADRGISARVPAAAWESVCREVEQRYRDGRFSEGSCAAIAAVGRILGQHFPAAGADADELPNQPILL
jgi:uncharacterized membrane protein